MLLTAVTLSLVGYLGLATLASALPLTFPSSTAFLLVPALARPEPLEQRLYLLAVCWFPMAALLLPPAMRLLFRRVDTNRMLARQPGAQLAVVGVLAVLFAVTMQSSDPYGPGATPWKTYFGSTIAGQSMFAGVVLSFLMVKVGFFPGERPFPRHIAQSYTAFTARFLPSLIGLCLLLAMAMCWFPFRRLTSDFVFWRHFDALAYSMFQVAQGETLLTDGFRNTYGLFPHLLAPFMSSPTVAQFTFMLACLTVACLALVTALVTLTVEDTRIRFLGAGTALYFGYFHWRAVSQDFYFQHLPIRVFFPLLAVYLGARYIQAPRTLLLIAGTLLCPLALLMNVEFGFVAVAVWSAAGVASAMRQERWIARLGAALGHVAVALAASVSGLALAWLYLSLRSGMRVQWRESFQSLHVFGQLGYMALPMPLVHPWWLVMLATIIALFWGVSAFNPLLAAAGRLPRPRDSVMLLLGILNLGAFAYYQGRSHSLTLTSQVIFVVPILAIVADVLWRSPARMARIACIPLLVALCAWQVELPNHLEPISELVVPNVRAWAGGNTEVTMERDFIVAHTAPDERILLLAKNQGSLLGEARRRSSFQPGVLDMFLAQELLRMKQLVKKADSPIILEDHFARVAPFIKLDLQQYEVAARGAGLTLYRPHQRF